MISHPPFFMLLRKLACCSFRFSAFAPPGSQPARFPAGVVGLRSIKLINHLANKETIEDQNRPELAAFFFFTHALYTFSYGAKQRRRHRDSEVPKSTRA
ncbi:hypothetical protein [Planomicrobium soli]|uniref:hypothetical protein n=1 Tax=Planomicrobium soli TaxID=1176648 RepID=UPI000D0CDB75|nr:hypothetical protein [Planomicrobium soli]